MDTMITALLGVALAGVTIMALLSSWMMMTEVRRLDRMAREAHLRSLATDSRCKVWCEKIGVKPVEHGSTEANDRRKAQEGRT